MTSKWILRARRIVGRLSHYRFHAGVFGVLLGLSELLWRSQTWTLRQLLDLATGGR